MQTLALIDRLDAMLDSARPVPLTDQIRVDKYEIRAVLDDMRTAVAADVGQGSRADPASDGELVAAVTAAVESVLRENIPAIAQAAADAARGANPPPGGPY